MNIRMVSAGVVLTMFALTGCGMVTLAPHLSREKDLGPPAAAERYSTVIDKAAAFEKQNLKSRDVYWYRAWRGSAMVGLGQFEQGNTVLEEVLREIAAAPTPPAQAERLRMFIHDLQAQALLGLGRPAEALGLLERAFSVAAEVAPETRGTCDRELMMTARLDQIRTVAAQAGNAARASTAQEELNRYVDRWARCLAGIDYPGMRVVSVLATTLKTPGGATVVAAPGPSIIPPPAIAPPPPSIAPPPPPPPVAVVPPPPVAVPGNTPVAVLASAPGKYALVNPAPFQGGIDSMTPLLSNVAGGARTEMVIRTDGAHHALKITMARLDSVEDAVPILKATVVFFEQTRDVKPTVDRVIVGSDALGVLATKQDVFDLFLERIDVATFVRRAKRVP